MVFLDETKQKGLQTGAAILDETNVVSERKEKKKKTTVKSSFAEICPIVDITNNDFFEMRSGEYLEIVQIDSKDIYSLNETDLQNDINNLATFFAAYNDDLKIIPLDMPLNLERQKNYIAKQLRKNKNPAYEPFLKARMKELENLEKFRTNREYFFFLYAEDEKKLLEKVRRVKGLLSRSNPVIEIPLEKKTNILFKMFNPNTKPLIEN